MNNNERLKFLTGSIGITPKSTALLILNATTIDDLQSDIAIKEYVNILTKIYDSISKKELSIVEDFTEVEIMKGEILESDSFEKKDNAYKNVHILKKNIQDWIKDNNLSIPTILADSDHNNLSLSEKQQTEKPLKDNERDNLLKVIGLLSMALADNNDNGERYGTKEKPNANNIADLLSTYIPNSNSSSKKEDTGITARTNRDRIGKGIKLIEQLK